MRHLALIGLLSCVGCSSAPIGAADLGQSPDLATPPLPQGDAMPPGAIAYFNAPACPTGWSSYALATGRVVVPISGDGEVGRAQGAPLAPAEDRAHSHALSGQVSLGSVSYAGIAGEANHGVASAGAQTLSGSSDAVSSGLPYVQLRLCQKIAAAVPSTRPIPAGALIFFEQATCPAGWARAAATQGRLLVGLPVGGTPGLAFGGPPLSDGEVRTHQHTVSGTLDPPAHGIALISGCCADGYASSAAATYSAPTAAVASGPPYLQLTQCQKQ